MMDGEALTVLLEWTTYGFSGEKELGLPASQSKTWLADRSFWQSWVKENEPQHIPPVKCIKWVCMKEEPVWGNEVVNDKLSTASPDRRRQPLRSLPHHNKAVISH